LQTFADEPRSTCSYCGSENCDDHRVPVFPSTASAAGVPAFSTEEAVAGWFSAKLVVPHVPPPEPIVQVNDVDPEAPVESVAVTVTFDVPAAGGVPEIKPLEELIDSPAGSPEAL
jgi:hypothetical protein